MINRELTSKEIEMLRLIEPTKFRDVVDEVRRATNTSRHSIKKEIEQFSNQ